MSRYGDFVHRKSQGKFSLLTIFDQMSLSIPISNFTAERAELVNGNLVFYGVDVKLFAMSDTPVAEIQCGAGSPTLEPEIAEDAEPDQDEPEDDTLDLCAMLGDLTLGQGDKRAREIADEVPEEKAELKRSKR